MKSRNRTMSSEPQHELDREVVSLAGVLEASTVLDGHCRIKLCVDDRPAAVQIHYPATLTGAVHAAICERVTLRGTVRPSPDGTLQMELVSLVVLSAFGRDGERAGPSRPGTACPAGPRHA
ncbi:hypothetical protein [Dactylosporangium sp. CS-033363]|uniref:hypothetical protein n=1 Tax=Dactylosporangium sp. CS-033363 TaxID=3239935 RepID=UPI003D8D6344